ncbi:hypothetical protein EDB85DRAFT_2218700 [Lactarius pseudohatsudake]|nr:hypothetical protein EDB85DRAFT_2218700 [Lactarius pseudohatsudake]
MDDNRSRSAESVDGPESRVSFQTTSHSSSHTDNHSAVQHSAYTSRQEYTPTFTSHVSDPMINKTADAPFAHYAKSFQSRVPGPASSTLRHDHDPILIFEMSPSPSLSNFHQISLRPKHDPFPLPAPTRAPTEHVSTSISVAASRSGLAYGDGDPFDLPPVYSAIDMVHSPLQGGNGGNEYDRKCNDPDSGFLSVPEAVAHAELKVDFIADESSRDYLVTRTLPVEHDHDHDDCKETTKTTATVTQQQ